MPEDPFNVNALAKKVASLDAAIAESVKVKDEALKKYETERLKMARPTAVLDLSGEADVDRLIRKTFAYGVDYKRFFDTRSEYFEAEKKLRANQEQHRAYHKLVPKRTANGEELASTFKSINDKADRLAVLVDRLTHMVKTHGEASSYSEVYVQIKLIDITKLKTSIEGEIEKYAALLGEHLDVLPDIIETLKKTLKEKKLIEYDKSLYTLQRMLGEYVIFEPFLGVDMGRPISTDDNTSTTIVALYELKITKTKTVAQSAHELTTASGVLEGLAPASPPGSQPSPGTLLALSTYLGVINNDAKLRYDLDELYFTKRKAVMDSVVKSINDPHFNAYKKAIEDMISTVPNVGASITKHLATVVEAFNETFAEQLSNARRAIFPDSDSEEDVVPDSD